ncbi:MAG: hypothetical protein JOZ69_17330 [Myxococcales bacterium]|nr:hypothetical protein [Myxococcales bacterium]
MTAVLAGAAGLVPVAACTLDFGRYTAVSGLSPSADASTDQSVPGDAGADGSAAEAPTAAPDAGDAAEGGGSACTPAPGCFSQATSCGQMCGRQYQTCLTGCADAGPCTTGCRSSLQGCLGTCATTCIACERDAGCPAPSACLDAAHS